MAGERKVYSVSEINAYIKEKFRMDGNLSVAFVRGEVSNCKYHGSGHIYFSLKDADAAISCVMFRGDRARGLDFELENGLEVEIGGVIDVYVRDGKYQLYAKKVRKAGGGELAKKYEELKKRLESLGYFDKERKKPIPDYAKTVGIVTADTGAAIQDIINISTRRNPYVQLILYPAKVQGEGAAEEIARGIRRLDGMVDVMIIGRGGGSVEDLWAFNEEVVARAVFECKTPIISAVGHETDFSISDFVADMRAPTPSAAAELAVFEMADVIDVLENYKKRLYRVVEAKIRWERERLAAKAGRLAFFNPASQIRGKREDMIRYEEKLFSRMKHIIDAKKNRLMIMAGRLDGVSPLKRMSAGYAYISDTDNKQVFSVDGINVGDRLKMTFIDGDVKAVVEDVKERESFYGAANK